MRDQPEGHRVAKTSELGSDKLSLVPEAVPKKATICLTSLKLKYSSGNIPDMGFKTPQLGGGTLALQTKTKD